MEQIMRNNDCKSRTNNVNGEMVCANIKIEPMEYVEEEIHQNIEDECVTNSKMKVKVSKKACRGYEDFSMHNGVQISNGNVRTSSVPSFEGSESTAFSKQNETCVVPAKLNVAIKTEIKEQYEHQNVDEFQDSFEMPQKDDVPFSCDDCGKALKTEELFKQEFPVTEDNQSSSQYGRQRCGNEAQTELSNSEEVPFSCDDCGIVLKTEQEFPAHSDQRPYSCVKCGKSFKTQKTLKQHVTYYHSEQECFPCSVCGKTFKTHGGRMQHYSKQHKNNKPYSCVICDKTFRKKQYLNEHRVCHSENIPFSCDICGKGFKKEFNLGRHVYIDHSKESIYSCKVCKRAYANESDYEQHRSVAHTKKETSFDCHVCGETFKVHAWLMLHLACHSENRPFSCQECGKAFKLRPSLISHTSICHP